MTPEQIGTEVDRLTSAIRKHQRLMLEYQREFARQHSLYASTLQDDDARWLACIKVRFHSKAAEYHRYLLREVFGVTARYPELINHNLKR